MGEEGCCILARTGRQHVPLQDRGILSPLQGSWKSSNTTVSSPPGTRFNLRTLRRSWKWLQLLYPAVQAISQSEELQLSKQESTPLPFGVYLERKMALQRLGERCDSLHPSIFRGSGLLTSPWNGPATSVPTTPLSVLAQGRAVLCFPFVFHWWT